jgi:hypothetical protein
VALVSILGGCNKGGMIASESKKLDACSLLTKEEIQAVQDSAITETKTSDMSNADFRISQCYFSAQQTSKSVSLMLTQSNPEHSNLTPKDYWQKTFARAVNQPEEREREREGEGEAREQKDKEHEEEAKPIKVDGVGDDAYWSADRMGGALYVLKNNSFIRISLGGPDDKNAKLEKSKTLAKKALQRM